MHGPLFNDKHHFIQINVCLRNKIMFQTMTNSHYSHLFAFNQSIFTSLQWAAWQYPFGSPTNLNLLNETVLEIQLSRISKCDYGNAWCHNVFYFWYQIMFMHDLHHQLRSVTAFAQFKRWNYHSNTQLYCEYEAYFLFMNWKNLNVISKGGNLILLRDS